MISDGQDGTLPGELSSTEGDDQFEHTIPHDLFDIFPFGKDHSYQLQDNLSSQRRLSIRMLTLINNEQEIAAIVLFFTKPKIPSFRTLLGRLTYQLLILLQNDRNFFV